jgi:predicted O-methyltransferase YrrM
VIAGTGRAGTSFLVRFMAECGLDTGEGEWFDRARAGLEHRLDPGDTAQPYVVKDPALSTYCEGLDLDRLKIDALIVPVRDLSEAAESRVLQERLRLTDTPQLHYAEAELTAWTTGGIYASLNVLDQARLLAVGFHRLVRWAAVNDVPLFLLDFPRMVEDREYLLGALSPWLERHCDPDRARAAFDATADASAIRVRAGSNGAADASMRDLDRQALVERIAELTTALEAAQARNGDRGPTADRRPPAASQTTDAAGEWIADGLYCADGTEFTVTSDPETYMQTDSTMTRFVLAKTPAMVDRLAGVISELAPKRIVELGIFKGGSAALLAALAKPTRLTAVDLASEPVEALERLIALRGLTDIVRPHYGIDQADVESMSALIAADHGTEPLDLVVDDASHLYRETRSSFELLFARLRPGGRYIIEDWGWAHFPGPEWQEGGGYFHDRPALTNLIIEILMLAATGPDLVARVDVMRDTVTVTRGPAQLGRPLRLEHHYQNRGLPFRPVL